MSNLVFVYGTLKRDCINHNYLKYATFIGDAETVEAYSMYQHKYGYPAVIEKGNEHIISGELYICDDYIMKSLDRLEGTPDLFYRKEIPILYNGNVLISWFYFFQVSYQGKDLREKIIEYKEF